MASRNLFKSLFLLIITLVTIGLLTFCLVSDWWIQVNEKKLEEIQLKFENDYTRFNGQQQATNLNEFEPNIYVPDDDVFTPKDNQVFTTSTTTTTTTTTTQETTTMNLYDYGQYDYSESGYDYSESANSYKNKRNAKVVDYVYVRKLWPLTKYKSLYSECIEYKEFPLKISAAYLVQSKKEPIIGEINYGYQLNSVLRAERTGVAACDQGEIRCVLSQECVRGAFCDGTIDCSDQSDEQRCERPVECKNDEHRCDNKCWKSWHKCDKNPHCIDLSDEKTCSQPEDSSMYSFFARMLKLENQTEPDFTKTPASNEKFTLGEYHYDPDHQCFVHYFNFKRAELVEKENLQYLSQVLADHLQEAKNINFHIHLIYSLSFASALVFCIMSLFSLLFVICFKKLCFQCPFWFYGFFNILAWLSSSFGLLTFLYEFMANKQRTLDPLARLPIENELIRLNKELGELQDFGLTFWFAVAATSMSFFSSFVSCIICCRLPTARHEDKEYKIMQLPTYS